MSSPEYESILKSLEALNTIVKEQKELIDELLERLAEHE